MINDTPFLMNFNMSEFMKNFSIPGMDNEHAQKLMSMHQKNTDAFVKASGVVNECYSAIAKKQMEIFQQGLIKLSNLDADQAGSFMEANFKESAEQMRELVEMATLAYKEAYDILSSRAHAVVNEIKVS